MHRNASFLFRRILFRFGNKIFVPKFLFTARWYKEKKDIRLQNQDFVYETKILFRKKNLLKKYLIYVSLMIIVQTQAFCLRGMKMGLCYF